MTDPKFTALVLAGGASTRMGHDKASLTVDGQTLLQRTVAAAAAQAENVIVSGPEIPLRDAVVTWSQEEPPRGGPVAALAAAAPLIQHDWLLVVPCDLAHPQPAVTALIDAGRAHHFDADAYLARDTEGRTQWLTGLVRRSALHTAIDNLGTVDAPVRALFGNLSLVLVDAPDDSPELWEDMDTPDDIARAMKGTT